MKDPNDVRKVVTYEVGNSLYINLTNRCSNSCDFCVRVKVDNFEGNNLWLDSEPSVEDVISELSEKQLDSYENIVFCGFGEPLERIDEAVEISGWLRERDVVVRVNTNGQANLIHGRDVTCDMRGVFDIVSISLNATCAEEYDELCHSEYGAAAYEAILEFARGCVRQGIRTVMTVVDIMSADSIEICREIAVSCGAEFRVREMIE